MELEPGKLLRETRIRHGLSQERLAIRAGTTQSAISRIEQERVSPTVQTLAELLHLLGEDLVLSTELRDWGIDRTLIDERLRMSEEDRIEYGRAFADQVIAMSPLPKRRGWEK
ncbi:MAG TPA: helix-turn-helix domain-containing protein [Solirubrobacterales bacterium]|nr:helix-turn-helix domain-containing protein [Solirubrobacterales bacterium]